MRDLPFDVDGVAVKSASDVIVDTARRHRPQLVQDLLAKGGSAFLTDCRNITFNGDRREISLRRIRACMGSNHELSAGLIQEPVGGRLSRALRRRDSRQVGFDLFDVLAHLI